MNDVTPAVSVSLAASSIEDLPLIENLMQFYNYDLSELCPVEFSPSGLYALQPKAQYWAKISVKPYVAKVHGEIAGFAVIDDEVQDSASEFNLGYFFLSRRYRGSGVAQEMIRQLFARHPGRWEVYFFAANTPAARFWPKAIALERCQNLTMHDTVVDGLDCRLYRFSTHAA